MGKGESAATRGVFRSVIDPLVEALERCSVRILGDRPGTGFFVSSGQVLTCAHVVGTQRTVGSGGIRVVWGDAVDEDAQVTGIWPDPDDDLALLRATFPDHPCVRLGTGMALDDEVYACGFPDYGAGAQGDGISGSLESLTRLPGGGRRPQAHQVQGSRRRPRLQRRTAARSPDR